MNQFSLSAAFLGLLPPDQPEKGQRRTSGNVGKVFSSPRWAVVFRWSYSDLNFQLLEAFKGLNSGQVVANSAIKPDQ
jgi:hypothetical protein